MIRETEQYHGVVLSRLIRGAGGMVRVAAHPELRSAYIVNRRAALYVKFSTSRLSPWSFVFSQRHHTELACLRDEFGLMLVALVCGGDGIVCLTTAEYLDLVENGTRLGEWVRVSRVPRARYAVSGSGGRPAQRISSSEYPTKLLRALAQR
jgi:hypothetical protein